MATPTTPSSSSQASASSHNQRRNAAGQQEQRAGNGGRRRHSGTNIIEEYIEVEPSAPILEDAIFFSGPPRPPRIPEQPIPSPTRPSPNHRQSRMNQQPQTSNHAQQQTSTNRNRVHSFQLESNPSSSNANAFMLVGPPGPQNHQPPYAHQQTTINGGSTSTSSTSNDPHQRQQFFESHFLSSTSPPTTANLLSRIEQSMNTAMFNAGSPPQFLDQQPLQQQVPVQVGRRTAANGAGPLRNKIVYELHCRFCQDHICGRAMRAILLADTKVELYSTDVPPSRLRLLDDDRMTQGCNCRIRDTACATCGNILGYHVSQPCEKCLEARNNGHFWMFYSDTVIPSERPDPSGNGKPLYWGGLSHASDLLDVGGQAGRSACNFLDRPGYALYLVMNIRLRRLDAPDPDAALQSVTVSTLKILSKEASSVIKHLADNFPLPERLGHLKRIRPVLVDGIKSNHVEIILGIQDAISDDERKGVLEKFPDAVESEALVSGERPLLKVHFERMNHLWPVVFHQSNVEKEAKEWLERVTRITEKYHEQLDSCLIIDPEGDLMVGSAKNVNSSGPLDHQVMRCIEDVACKQRLNPSNQYLCTGFVALLRREPCFMCAMALVHSRIAALVFLEPNEELGALQSQSSCDWIQSCNHRYQVYTRTKQ